MDISQVDFADASALHRNKISAIERGEIPVDEKLLEKLACALRCPVAHLKSAAQRIFDGYDQDGVD